MTEIEKAAVRSGKEYKARSLANQYRQYDKNNGYDPLKTITSDEVYSIALADGCKCEYCGCSNWRLLGIDRKDSSKGHTLENSVCACTACNIAKGDNYDYDTYKEISKIYKLKKTKFIMNEIENGHPIRSIEDLTCLCKLETNREIKNFHVQEISRYMQKYGKVPDPYIKVDRKTLKIIDGQHRVAAAIDAYQKTGMLVDLYILFEDYENENEMAKIMRSSECGRKPWDIADFVNSFKFTKEYDELMAFMNKHGIKNYKVIMHLIPGLKKDRMSESLNLSGIDIAEKVIVFLKNAYGEDILNEKCADKLASLRNLCIAIRLIFSGESKTNKTKGEVNGKIRLIYGLMEQNNHDFMAYAPYFSKYVQRGIEQFIKNHKQSAPSSVDIVNIIVNNIYSMEGDIIKDKEKKNKRSIRKVE